MSLNLDDQARPEVSGLHDNPDNGSAATRQYTIKGIDAETLERMRLAARKQGMKVGAWLSARIREAADQAIAEEGTAREQLATLREHIARIEKNQEQEQCRLVVIQTELSELMRAQHSMMSQLLSKA